MRSRKRRIAVAVAAAVAVSTAAGAALTGSAQAAGSDVTVDWTITQDWGSGYQGSVRITNSTDHAIDPWSVTVPYGNSITSIWDAQSSATSDGYRFSGPSWQAGLPAHASVTFGFVGSPRGAALTPASCAIPAGSCTVTGTSSGGSTDAGSSTPAPTPTATPTTTPTATPTVTPTASPSGSGSTQAKADVTVTVKVSSDWGTGRNVDMTVTNTSGHALSTWSVTMPWKGSSVSMWNATGTLAAGTLTAAALSWNASLAPGASASIGMTDNGAFAAPLTCTSTAGSCTIDGSGTASSATPTPTATPTVKPTTDYTPAPGAYTGSRKIVGYYPSWATYARNYQVADIPGQKLTHVNFAFANIANGRCVVGDSYADTDKAFAGDSWDQGAKRGNFNQLTKLKEANPNLKTMISIGGWTWSQNFSAAAATDTSRKALVSSCVDFMKTYGFDGIDIDWEYPVSGGLYPGTAADKANYTSLLQEFKTELNAAQTADKHSYYLSIAAPAGPTTIPNLEAANIGKVVDWMNLMSYDYHGSWDPITGHNAPMSVGSKDTAAGFSVTDAVDSYLKAGFPAGKLVLGVPFYGRGWEGAGSANNGLYSGATSASVGTWEKGVFDYTDIVKNYLPTMTRYWDSEAKVPYLYDSAKGLWISYDDPESMRIKADYIKSNGLGGAMIWELSGDRQQELLDTLVTSL